MNKSQSIKFLTDLGVPEARAKKMCTSIPDDATVTPDDELEEALTSAVSHQRELYTTSQEYKDKIKSLRDGSMGEARTKASKKIVDIAKLTAEEIKDKSFDEIVDLAVIKIGKNGNKTTEELQVELQRVNEELRKANEEVIPGIRKEVDTEKENFKNDAALYKSITGLKLRKGVDHEDVMVIIKAKAAKLGYKISRDEKDETVFTDADGNKLQNAEKKAFLKSNEILTSFVDSMIEKSNAREEDEDEEEDDNGGKPGARKAIIKDKKKPEERQGSAVSAARKKAEDHAKAMLEKKKP